MYLSEQEWMEAHYQTELLAEGYRNHPKMSLAWLSSIVVGKFCLEFAMLLHCKGLWNIENAKHNHLHNQLHNLASWPLILVSFMWDPHRSQWNKWPGCQVVQLVIQIIVHVVLLIWESLIYSTLECLILNVSLTRYVLL